ncbi:Protein TOS2 [Nakaseomyces bracarensis]|uniref:Protein TOS2 n=1 Tax=Nakaseomyces bracarensis TaxID=273131 RepID=A0ABR4NWI7_9SACH
MNTIESYYVTYNRPTSTLEPTPVTLFRRDDDDSSSTMTSASESASSTNCVGSSQQCDKPEGNHWKETVGIAVGVPAGVVLIFLVVILLLVWRKGKKEAVEDLDPEFQSANEYLPNITNEKSYNGCNSDSSVSSGMDAPYKSRADIFQLPDASTDSLRDFARNVHDTSMDKYKLATSSLHNKSKLSLVSNNKAYNNNNQQYNNHQLDRTQELDKDSFDFTQDSTISTLEESSTPLKKKVSVSDEAGNETTLNPFESEEDQLDNTRPQIIVTDDSEMKAEDSLKANEEEDIDRIKSIYKIYLDKNGNEIPMDVSSAIEAEREEVQDDIKEPVKEVPQDNNTDLNGLGIQTGTGIEAHRVSRIASSVYSENPITNIPENAEVDYFNQKPTQAHNVVYDNQYPSNYQAQQTDYAYDPQYHQQQQEYYMQNYQPPMVPQMMYYPPHSNQQYHPQTLEEIDELPTPTELAYSPSYHSLTSFKKPTKQQLLIKNQIATLNGFTLNPIDHPEMFFTQDDSYSKYQEKIAPMSKNYSSKNAQTSVPLPHHLRQSVVMTNPHDLSLPTTHKPAGSFRNIHKLTTNQSSHLGVDSDRYGNKTRVSGLLDDTDVVQPASVGEILPRHGNNDDLRKQLGISHNYHIHL